MQIDRPLVEYLAKLSRLRLSEEEIPVYQRQLTEIVALMEQLAAIDVSSVPETAHALEAVNVFRPDEPQPSFPREKLLENAPDAKDGAFAVPKVIG
jgi:aspartyl-tRNA(Asn)/glutamyl-tRNA(Gln) amidotransferase subunit C